MQTDPAYTPLHPDSSREVLGAMGTDPGGRHHRLVYPVVDTAHLTRAHGALIERARHSGVIVEIPVAQIHSVTELVGQMLAYTGRQEKDPNAELAQHMREHPEAFDRALEVRTGYVSFVDGNLLVRLSSGEEIDVQVSGSIHGPFELGGWVFVGDDFPSAELRPEGAPVHVPEIQFSGVTETGLWVLYAEPGEAPLTFIPVPTHMSTEPGEIYFIGPHLSGRDILLMEGGLGPVVLTDEMRATIEAGRASSRLVASLMRESRRQSMLPEEPSLEDYAVIYGVWYTQPLRISRYVLGGCAVDFGASKPVRIDSASSAPTDADDRDAKA